MADGGCSAVAATFPNVERFKRYPLDDGNEYTALELHAMFPHLKFNTLRKRLRAGARQIAVVGAPFNTRGKRRPKGAIPMNSTDRKAWEHQQREAPLNAAFRAWRHTTRGWAMVQLDVHTDPLRAAL